MAAAAAVTLLVIALCDAFTKIFFALSSLSSPRESPFSISSKKEGGGRSGALRGPGSPAVRQFFWGHSVFMEERGEKENFHSSRNFSFLPIGFHVETKRLPISHLVCEFNFEHQTFFFYFSFQKKKIRYLFQHINTCVEQQLL